MRVAKRPSNPNVTARTSSAESATSVDGHASRREENVNSSLWPAPNYLDMLKHGVSSKCVDFARGVRDVFLRRPQLPFATTDFTHSEARHRERMLEVRDVANESLSRGWSSIHYKRMREICQDMHAWYWFTDSDWYMQTLLYKMCGHQISLGGWCVVKGFSPSWDSIYMVRRRRGDPFWIKNKEEKIVSAGGTIEDAIATFAKGPYKMLAATERHGRTCSSVTVGSCRLSVYDWGDERPKPHRIGVRVNTSTLDLYAFDSNHDAHAWLSGNKKRVIDRLKEVLRPCRMFPPVRNVFDLVPEQDATTATRQEFEREFSSGPVRFGRRFTAREKSAHLAAATGALRALAEIVGVSAYRLFFNKSLSLWFAATDRAGGYQHPVAIYRTAARCIVLSRAKGVGALAHEWWHALDNHLCFNNSYYSERFDPELGNSLCNLFWNPMTKLVAFTSQNTSFGKRSAAFDSVVDAKGGRLDKPDHRRACEATARMFEAWIVEKAKELPDGKCPPYLCEIFMENEWKRECDVLAIDGKTGKPFVFIERSTYPYPTPDEVAQYDNAMNDLLKMSGIRDHLGVFPR